MPVADVDADVKDVEEAKMYPLTCTPCIYVAVD